MCHVSCDDVCTLFECLLQFSIFADASKNFADAPKIFRLRVEDFADASRDFTADVVTLPTRPVTVGSNTHVLLTVILNSHCQFR